MITQLKVSNFKAFSRHTVAFKGDALLVGPNSAGKSTLIEALRLAARMISHATRVSPSGQILDEDLGMGVQGYYFTAEQFDFVDENLQHEFHDTTSTVDVTFQDKSALRIVWPPSSWDDDRPFFYLMLPNRSQVRRPKDVARAFTRIGIVPVLTPIEQNETMLDPAYVRRNYDGRLASRHFRNQLNLIPSIDDFLRFAEPWLDELQLREFKSTYGPRGLAFDLYYREREGLRDREYYREREGLRDREIYWAGDGMQIWLQILLHLYRLREARVIILDEPDVYLHADLQRRLIRLLATLPGQTIAATHSAEMLSEADPASVIWVDKTRRRAVAAPKESILSSLSAALGSQFNLRLAKALRSRVVLFVEGEDMKVLRNLAGTIQAHNLATERGISVLPLKGFSNWVHIEPFGWMVRELLSESVDVVVLLDRDYRTQDTVDQVLEKLRDVTTFAHVWSRKELESYLLVPEAMARSARRSLEWINSEVDRALEAQRATVASGMLEERHRTEVDASHHRTTVTRSFLGEFEPLWGDRTYRLEHSPPKDILSLVNRELEKHKSDGARTISIRGLSMSIRPQEVPWEMRDQLLRVERLLNPA
jgi:hypothetical protein